MNELLDGPTKLRKNMICICIDDLGEGTLGYALMIFICHFYAVIFVQRGKQPDLLRATKGKVVRQKEVYFANLDFLSLSPRMIEIRGSGILSINTRRRVGNPLKS